MDNKILITGASGFLGSIIVKNLSRLGFSVLTLGKATGNNLQVDLTSGNINLPANINTVIHAAGKAHSNPNTKAEEQVFFDVNFEGTKNLCDALIASSSNIRAFIFISTVSVYGLDKGELISETYPLQGKSAYAKSKIMAEEWLMQWANENNIVLSILRLPLVAGPNPPGNLGAMIKGISTGRYFSIGKADARKSIVWAGDIAGIIPSLTETGGIYNLTDGYNPSLKQLEEVMSKSLCKKSPVAIPLILAKILGIAGDLLGKRFPVNNDKLKKLTSTLTFDDQKARTILGWKPSLVLEKIGKSL